MSDCLHPFICNFVRTHTTSSLFLFSRCGLHGAETPPGGKWSKLAPVVFEELMKQVVSLTVQEKAGDKYLVVLRDENGVDVLPKLQPPSKHYLFTLD